MTFYDSSDGFDPAHFLLTEEMRMKFLTDARAFGDLDFMDHAHSVVFKSRYLSLILEALSSAIHSVQIGQCHQGICEKVDRLKIEHNQLVAQHTAFLARVKTFNTMR